MDINNFGPFNSYVWGSVSDWIMILVTSTTAFFLWKTLKSQTKVQNDQNAITKIEQSRFLKEIQPMFSLEVEEFNTNPKPDGTTEISFPKLMRLRLNENTAYDIIITPDPQFHESGTWTLPYGTIEKVKVLPFEEVSLIALYNSNQGISNALIWLHFNITFSDELGNKYHQLCTFEILNNQPHSLSKSPSRVS